MESINSKKFNKRAYIIILIFAVLLILTSLFSLTLGRYQISLSSVAGILLTPAYLNSSGHKIEWTVVWIVRLPRIIVVILAGMGLALSGATLQGIFRNPLVGPQIVGVSSGASFGGVLAILLSMPSSGVVGLAFAFGMLSLVMVFGLSRLAGKAGILSLVLAGIILSSFYSALVGIIQYLADPETKLPGIVYWLMGSFAAADWKKVPVIGVPTLISGTILLLLRWRINLLSLGDTDAAALGIKVGIMRWTVLVLVSIIVAAQVSVSGGVGWVGLVIPHFTRMMVGPDHRVLLPASALLGGIYLLIMDCLARNLTMLEIPIGLLTALIGTPFFAFVFWKTQARGWGRE